MEVVFSDALDATSIGPEAFRFTTWSPNRNSTDGSNRLNERTLEITTETLGPEGRSVRLGIASLQPTDC